MAKAGGFMRIIDLFSGAGGLTFGFYYRIKQNRFVRNRKNSFVFANEIDSFAAEAFEAKPKMTGFRYWKMEMAECRVSS
mgnify:CR=1 FL=1